VSLDPQLAPLVKDLDAAFPAVHTMTGAQARDVIRSRFVPAVQPEPVAEVRDQTIPGPGGDIPVRSTGPTARTFQFSCTRTAAVLSSAIWTATTGCAAISPIAFAP
jgi:hypothetical protein